MLGRATSTEASYELWRSLMHADDRHLAEHPHGAPGRDRLLAFERGAQLFAVEKLHGQRERAVVGRLEVEHLHDVIVGQQLADLELALETLHRDLIVGYVGVQHLERDVAPLLHVERLVHAPHAAVGDHELTDAGVLVVGQDRDLRRAG